MIIKSETAIKSIETGEAFFDGVTSGHGDLGELKYAIITNTEHARVDHVETEKHVVGEDFEAVLVEGGIIFSSNSGGTVVYRDFEGMIENIGEWFREEAESKF